MARTATVFLAGVFAFPSFLFCQVPSGADEGTTVSSKICAVTVYADRARVTRVADISLRAGIEKFVFRKLPAWIDEGSVQVGVLPPDSCEIVDVEVQRTFLARPDDEEIRKAQDAVQEIADQIASLDDERSTLEAQARQVEAIRTFTIEKMPRDAAVREIKTEEYRSLINFLGAALGEIAIQKREIEKKKRVLQPELDARRKKLDELRRRTQLEQNSVVVTVRRKGAAATAKMTLTYFLPGATWQPVHELRTGGGLEKVTLASYAIASQTTGEDWDGVALTFSTQRPTRILRIPELEKLVAGAPSPPAADTFGSASAKFESQFSVWNAFANAAPVQQVVEEQRRAQEKRQAAAVSTFAQVQEKRGTTAQFAAEGLQIVRTDGKTVRIPIGSVTLDAKPALVAAPELSLNAVRTVEVVNAGRQPILPGRILLYIEGAFVGTTEADFVGSGESFTVFAGVADEVKLSRTLDRKRSSLSWSGKKKRMQVCFVLTAENLSDGPVALQMSDRIPVSETDEIRVLNVKIQPEAKPDTRGILKWNVSLGPKEAKEFRIEYTLEYPPQPAFPAEQSDKSPSGRGGVPSGEEGALESIRTLERLLH